MDGSSSSDTWLLVDGGGKCLRSGNKSIISSGRSKEVVDDPRM